MISVFFIGKTLLTALMYIFILRLWMHYVRVSFYNPFTQFIVKITQPVLLPLRRLVPATKQIDFSAILVIYVIALLKVILVFHYLERPIWQFSYLFYAVCAIFSAIGYLLFWLLLIRAILSWVSQGQTYADDVLIQLTEPLVQPIRRLIPPFGLIDLSFMILVFVLMALNYIAYDLIGAIWHYL